MINCERKRDGKVKVTFRVPGDVSAGKISVVGDFNDWAPGANPLRRSGDARTGSVTLDGGRRYAFRYLGEGGEWFNDQDAHGYEHNEYGETNGVIDLTDGNR